ncbi:hypothetical protein [Caulobacter vibrioides]|uniref:Uncharacterized protein n=1 Tax=Caulobacter phage S2B TaxID=2759120 RepID=A0AAE7ML26_9CAUD|nr:hypothetical protein [Caulobacter vibrioides]QOC54120.1 hypothetical protein [Caulobacter phage S2B]QXZ50200.1 hypothetical protein KZH45_09715 [Caulobacter vibrioides]
MTDHDTSQSTDLLLGRIDGKLTALIEAFGLHRGETDRRFEKHEAVHEEHDGRLVKLERSAWLLAGLAAIAASGLSMVLTALLGKVFS